MFAKRLSELRKAKGLSQYELADRLGFSRGQLANYEQGKRQPDHDVLGQIADFFEVSTDYLLGRTNVKYQFEPNHQYESFEDFISDPVLMDFIKEDLKDATPEKIEKLRAMYKIINNS